MRHSTTSKNSIASDQSFVLKSGFQRLSRIRSLCLKANENFRTAGELQEEADRILSTNHPYREFLHPLCHPLLCTTRRDKEDRQRVFRYDRAAERHIQQALDDLRTAYSIANVCDDKKTNHQTSDSNPAIESAHETSTTTTTIIEFVGEDNDQAFRLLRKQYHRWMVHIGEGVVPTIDDESKLYIFDACLGQAICMRQIELLNDAMAQIETDWKALAARPKPAIRHQCGNENSLRYCYELTTE